MHSIDRPHNQPPAPVVAGNPRIFIQSDETRLFEEVWTRFARGDKLAKQRKRGVSRRKSDDGIRPFQELPDDDFRCLAPEIGAVLHLYDLHLSSSSSHRAAAPTAPA